MKPIYDDGTYTVTQAVIATPRRFYPIAHTTASIRRDPLWLGLSMTGFGAGCLGVYGDLLRPYEIAFLAVVCLLGLVAGWSFSILRIDAIGHRRAMIVASHGRIRRLYAAIRDARLPDTSVTLEDGR